MNSDENQERIPNLYETLYDLSKFMTGELDGVPSDSTDPIQSVTLIRDQIFVTTCGGLWRFQPEPDGNSTIELMSRF